MSLKNKTVLITGASRGIGRQVALTFAQAGAIVIVGARTEEGYTRVVSEVGTLGAQAQGVLLDVTQNKSIEDAVHQVINTHKKIDILINCAGVIMYHTPVWQTSIEDWDQMMSVNLRGTFLCCRAVIHHMIEQGAGIIINLGSSSARMADDDLGPYTASKWGVVGYTTSLAKSVRAHGVRVNGLNPGWVDTDMSRRFNAEGDSDWSTSEEIANAALYLATSAPRDMTGQFIDIFGS